MRVLAGALLLSMGACGGGDSSTIAPTDGGTKDSSKSDGSGTGDSAGTDSATGNPEAGPVSVLTCGTISCDVSMGDACCVQLQGGGSTMFTCTSPCPTGSTALSCGNAPDCGSSEVCCADPKSNPITAQCKASCASGEAMLCDPSLSAAVNRCGSTGACSSTNVATWGLPSSKYGTCGGVTKP